MKRKKITKILRSTAFAVVFCLSCVIIGSSEHIPSHADTIADLEEKIKEREKKIEDLDAQIAAAEGDIADNEVVQGYYWEKLVEQQEYIDLLKNQLYNKEEEIAQKEGEIADKDVEIADTERRIADKTSEIAALDAQNRENIYKFGQIIRTMYINGSDDVLSVLEGSTDFYDIFVRTEIMNSASKQNLEFMNSLLSDIHRLEDDQVQLEKDKVQLQADKEGLEEDKRKLEAERLDLDEKKNYTNTLISSYTTEYNNAAAKIKNLEALQAQYKYEKSVSMEEIKAYEDKIDEEIRKAQEAASNAVVYQDGDWRWPLDPKYTMITTYFGYDDWRAGNHHAIDVGNGGINGANIYAMKAGEVIVAKTTYTAGYDYGMYIVIDHGNGFQSLYAHCSAIYVSVGQMVNQGDVIGAVGSTGFSTGPHLHFEIRKDGVRVDPLGYVNIP